MECDLNVTVCGLFGIRAAFRHFITPNIRSKVSSEKRSELSCVFFKWSIPLRPLNQIQIRIFNGICTANSAAACSV